MEIKIKKKEMPEVRIFLRFAGNSEITSVLLGVWEKADKVCEEAVENTSGQVLTCNGKLKLVPYHQISAGRQEMEKPCFK